MNERSIEVPTEDGDTITMTESECPNCEETVPYETGESGGCHKCQASTPFQPVTAGGE
jgi:Zn finger protein HypA/HybF involved in hydrogenase expression